MPTKLYADIVYGPVKSRRLGISLGVNLSPADGKACTFNCIYCECGLNEERKTQTSLPDRKLVIEALEHRLSQLAEEGIVPDRISFAGNGEPSLHPAFADIIDDVIHLRNIMCPETKIAVFSNATTLGRKGVFESLLRVDEAIMKLDAGSDKLIQLIDSPNVSVSIEQLIKDLSRFEGKLIVQTMFLRGLVNGIQVDNTTEEELRHWMSALHAIKAERVMIYTISRDTPFETLTKLSADEMNQIGEKVRQQGFKVQISY